MEERKKDTQIVKSDCILVPDDLTKVIESEQISEDFSIIPDNLNDILTSDDYKLMNEFINKSESVANRTLDAAKKVAIEHINQKANVKIEKIKSKGNERIEKYKEQKNAEIESRKIENQLNITTSCNNTAAAIKAMETGNVRTTEDIVKILSAPAPGTSKTKKRRSLFSRWVSGEE